MTKPLHAFDPAHRLYLGSSERKIEIFINLDNYEWNRAVQDNYWTLNEVCQQHNLPLRFKPIIDQVPKSKVVGDGICGVYFNPALIGTNIYANAPSFAAGGKIYEVDIAFNPQPPTPLDTKTVKKIAWHEIFHNLGYGHPDQVGLEILSVVNSRLKTSEQSPTDNDWASFIYEYTRRQNPTVLANLRARKARILARQKPTEKRQRRIARLNAKIEDQLGLPL